MGNEETLKQNLIRQWVEWYDRYADSEPMKYYNFESFSLGFFIAKGASLNMARELYRRCVDIGKF